MVFNWQQFASPEQLQAVVQIRERTRDIRARIVVDENSVTVTLEPQTEEAKQYLQPIADALVNSIGTTLNVLFSITGTVRRQK